MPRYIVKLEDYYLEWSTIVDAPVTYGMPLEEFKEYYQEEYGLDGMRYLAERLKRVEAKGISSRIHSSVENLLTVNRAGENGKDISIKEIIEKYCHNRGIEE